MIKRLLIICLIALFGFSPIFASKFLEYERITGSWELYLEKSPQEVIHAREKMIKPDCYIEVPGFWNEAVREYLESDNPRTYGCYRYVKKNLKANQKYGLLIKDSPATSCAIYVNGERIVQSGDPYYSLLQKQNKLLDKKTSRSHIQPLYGEFYPNEKGNAEIVVFISNYFYRKSGLWDVVYFGPAKDIFKLNTLLMFFYTLINGILLFIGLMNIIQFFINKNHPQYIYLGLIAIVCALRLSTAGYCSLGVIFPNLSGELKIRLEYLVLWILPVCMMQQLYVLYPAEKDYIKFPWIKEKIVRLLVALPSILFGIATWILPASQANELVPKLQMGLGLISFFVVCKIVYEITHKKRYIGFYFFSCITLIIGGAIDIVYTYSREILPMPFFPFFVAIFIFIQITLLAVYQNDIYKDTLRISNDLQKLNEAYLRFVPKEFLKLLNKENITSIKLGDFSQIEMSIIFSKIEIKCLDGKKDLSPEMHFKIFNLYLQKISPLIKQNNGFVSKFLSGGFMALFPQSENDAVRTAMQIVKMASEINEQIKPINIKVIPRIGVHYGRMVLGTIGEENRLDDTVISDTVNTSARIESVCERLDKKLIISHLLEERVDMSQFPEIILNELDSISVKGKEKPLQLYECFIGESL